MTIPEQRHWERETFRGGDYVNQPEENEPTVDDLTRMDSDDMLSYDDVDDDDDYNDDWDNYLDELDELDLYDDDDDELDNY